MNFLSDIKMNNKEVGYKSDIALNRTTLGTQCKNLLNETEYLASIKTATNGTLSKSGNSITLTATSNDCYLIPFFANDNGYRIPVSPNTTYILSWESDNSNYGIIHVFMNGIIAKQQSANNSVTKYLKFITDIDATFITIRFSVKNSGDSITYSNIMLRYADITDDTYEPYKESVDERLIQNKSDIAVNKTTLGYQCKNLLKNETGNTVMGGVTFTHNSDGSVTLNGTSDGQYFYTLMSKDFENILGKKCILTGCPANGSNSTFGIYIRTDIDDYIYDSGAGVTFTTDSIIWINIVVRSGVTFDNVTFYPMLRYADITDDTDTYEPYKENIDERLIQNKSDIAVNKSTLGYSKKNLFDWKVSNKAANFYTTVTSETDTTISMSSKTKWSRISYKLPTVEIDKSYILSVKISDLDESGGNSTRLILSYDLSGSDVINAVSLENNGVYELEFNVQGNEESIYLLLCLNWSGTNFTDSSNSFTASEIMLRYADILDDTYEPYQLSVDERLIQNKSDIAVNKSTLGYQCKNFHDTLSVNWYQPDKTSVASNGTVTTTITSDSRSFTYANSEHYITLEAGKYIITANTLEFVAGSSALIRGCNSDNQSLFALSVSSAGLHEAAFSLSKKTTIGIMYKLYSQTCTIMIRDADILDDTYEVYKANVNERLIEDKSNITINKSTLGYQRKNLLKNNAVTQTVNGVTFTVNDDKSVTLNGTSTAQADFYLRGAWGSTSEILQKNKYIASIGVLQSSTFNGVVMHCINNTTSIGSASCNYPSLVVNSAITAVYISVSKGYTFSNYKLYPMIRDADILDDTYEPYQPSLIDRCMLKDNTGTILYNGGAAANTASITIENLSKYSLVCAYIAGASTRSYRVSCSLPISYLSKGNTLNIGGIPSSNSSGDECVKDIDGYITASMTTDSPDVLNLKIDNGIIGSIQIISVM